ncbi:MAG: hypothetical protein HKN82_02355 [Akkermansiaceae bacterium]|nr:hypothetical protein [Akkermansiaceae bacterium]NNM28965.1 hypothetical protein [Akkermansiaceae bacterium]
MPAIASVPPSTVRAERLWALVALAWLVALNLWRVTGDFDDWRQNDLAGELSAAFHEPFALREIPIWLGRSAAFGIFGWLLAGAHDRFLRRLPLWVLPALALLFCLSIEAAKLYHPGRHASAAAAAGNAVALWAGLWGGSRWKAGRRFSAGAWREFGRGQWIRIMIAIPLGITLWSLSVFRPVFGAPALQWSGEFPLVIGNEADGNRPWSGRIRHLGIFGFALGENDVAALRAGLTTGPESPGGSAPTPLAAWDFAGGPVTELPPAGILSDPRLTLSIPAECEWDPTEGLTLHPPALVRSRGPATAITEAVRRSRAFSASVLVTPANVTQGGPARIVSLSGGVGERNFTLGQNRSDLVFRVRNEISGANGLHHAARSEGEDITGTLRHVVAVYDRGKSSLYLDGRRLDGAMSLRDPAYYLPFGMGGAARISGMVFLAFAVGPLVFCLAASAMPARRAHLITLAALYAAGGGTYTLACAVTGEEVRGGLLAVLAVVLGGAYFLAMAYVRRSAPGEVDGETGGAVRATTPSKNLIRPAGKAPRK